MSSTATPYGLIPVGTMGGPYNGQTRKYKIASGYGTNIFTGDVVLAVSDGTVGKDTGTATANPLGIFMGCEFTDPNSGQLLQRPYWPASTVASDAYAFVADNPYLVMQVQAAATVAQADCFLNAALVQGAGSTTFGKSRVTIGSQNTTNTLPVKIIGFVNGPDSAPGDAFTDCLVVWNLMAATTHEFFTPLGT